MKYIKIEESQGRWFIKTKKNVVLGEIEYYKSWKQYVVLPYAYTVWSVECLQDIVKFLKEKNKK